jgi:hypothetical protein
MSLLTELVAFFWTGGYKDVAPTELAFARFLPDPKRAPMRIAPSSFVHCHARKETSKLLNSITVLLPLRHIGQFFGLDIKLQVVKPAVQGRSL